MPLFQWRYIKVFGEQVTCLNVLQPKTTRSKSVGNQVGFILDTAREITQYQGWYCPCKVLEHIQPGVSKLWAWPGTSCQISANIRLEMKCTIKILCLNHPETIPPTPGPWNNCLPWTQFLVPKSWGPLIYRMWALISRSVYVRLAHSRLGVVGKWGQFFAWSSQ